MLHKSCRAGSFLRCSFALHFDRRPRPLLRTRGHVEAHPQELRIYESSSGRVPFAEWLGRLRDARARAAIRVRLDRLADGNAGHCDPVGHGVRELKINVGLGYRVYFAHAGPAIILLLIGGVKASQQRDIRTAQEYWREYKGSE